VPELGIDDTLLESLSHSMTLTWNRLTSVVAVVDDAVGDDDALYVKLLGTVHGPIKWTIIFVPRGNVVVRFLAACEHKELLL
jgi:hypothetical protein